MYHPNPKRGAMERGDPSRTGVHFAREIFIESDSPERAAGSFDVLLRNVRSPWKLRWLVLIATSNRTITRIVLSPRRSALGSNSVSSAYHNGPTVFPFVPPPPLYIRCGWNFHSRAWYASERLDNPLTNWIKQVSRRFLRRRSLSYGERIFRK